MKKRPTTSGIDGFVPRRSGRVIGQPTRPIGLPRPLEEGERQIRTAAEHTTTPARRISRGDIDESLRQIDTEEETSTPKRKLFRRKRKAAVAHPRKKLIKRIALIILALLVVLGLYVGIKALIASGNIFKGNPFDIFLSQPLKQDENGRSNILIFGTSEDDPEHSGATLTDSIMVLSIDQTKKNAYMISVPRDLYVEYGDSCPEGYQGKINSMYSCYSNDGENEAEGAAALQKKVGEIFGLDIQYYAHLNYTVVRDAVNAVGGVDVKIESNPKGVGILDRNFDWKCGYRCYYVKYEDGQIAHLDGEHALALARARNAAGGYGLAAGNFDREKNQQKIIKALREKAVSAGTLTNIGKVTSLIDALGNNLRTNFETKEIQTLMTLGNETKSESIKSIDLVAEGQELMTTGNVGGASIVRPVAGLYDYSDLKQHIKKQLTASEVTKEAAEIVVLNGSGVAGLAQREADKLEEKGFIITVVDTAPEDNYADVEIYQIGEGKPATKAKLKALFNVEKVKTGAPPIAVTDTTDFVIIFGKAPSSANQ